MSSTIINVMNAEDEPIRTPNIVVRQFNYQEIESVTNHFSEFIGEGTFGLVYRGNLSDGSDVAIKMLVNIPQDGQRETFLKEVFPILLLKASKVSIFPAHFPS